MAFEVPILNIPGFLAGEDLSAKQFHFVYLDGSDVLVVDDAALAPVGVLQNKPTEGQIAEIMAIGYYKAVG